METITKGFASECTLKDKSKRHMHLITTIDEKKSKWSLDPIISLLKKDYANFDQEHDDLMVITITIHNYTAKRILVDQGNLANILYDHMTKAITYQ